MNNYLIPANSKKSKLIFGLFTRRDLMVIGIGGTFTLMMLLIFNDPSFIELIFSVIPLLTAALLVFPVPYYHNILQLLENILNYYTSRKKYYWRGWCVKYDKDDESDV